MPSFPDADSPAQSSSCLAQSSTTHNGPSSKSLPSQSIKRSKKGENEAAIREAKAHIRENVREDWTWPPTDIEVPASRCVSLETQWRERESDSSPAPSPPPGIPELSPSLNPYRFDNPDSLLEVKCTRKRKREHALQEELNYNTGLCDYMRRRDAWTGAIPVPPSPSESVTEYESSESLATGSGSDDSDLSSLSTTASNLSTTCCVGVSASISCPDSSMPRPREEELGIPNPPVIVPLPPPLLPSTHPIRAAISTATYPSIYSKIVVQGLTPTVPVNLKDMVCAIVDGWTRDGEWPPKDSEGRVYQGNDLSTQISAVTMGDGMGRALAKRGVGKMRRALGLEKEGGFGEG